MTLKTKSKGTRIEHTFKRYLEEFGYYVCRAAGSFGVDLVAIKKDVPPLFVNVKALRKYCSPKERLELVELSKKFGTQPILAYVTKTYPEKRGRYCLENLRDKTDTSKPSLSDLVVLEQLGKEVVANSVYENRLWVVLGLRISTADLKPPPYMIPEK